MAKKASAENVAMEHQRADATHNAGAQMFKKGKDRKQYRNKRNDNG